MIGHPASPGSYGRALLQLAALAALCLNGARGFEKLNVTRNPCFRSSDGREFCVPHTYVVGMPKAGTSALWLKLGNNTQFDLRPRKEYCPRQDLSPQSLIDWAELFPKPDELQQDRLILSGCIGLSEGVGKRYFKQLAVQGVEDFRVLLMLRDYPEWMYAKYNYWCGTAYGDSKCDTQSGNQRTADHHRSAAHFHALLSSSRASKELRYPGWKATVEGLLRVVGRERMMVLSQHDLYDDGALFLEYVEEFLSVPHYSYPKDLVKGVVNHSNNKGVRATSTELRPGRYADVEDMLPETRELLAQQWKEDCLWLQQEWDLCFASCCSEDPDARRQRRRQQLKLRKHS